MKVTNYFIRGLENHKKGRGVFFFLFLLLFYAPGAYSSELSWDPVVASGDCPVMGYRIHVGTSSGNYNKAVVSLRMLEFSLFGYTPAVSGDIGKTVLGAGRSTGKLLAFDNTIRKWWVQLEDPDATPFDPSGENVWVIRGRGSGKTVLNTADSGGFVYDLSNLPAGIIDSTSPFYFAVSSFDSRGQEGEFSDEVLLEFTPPANLRLIGITRSEGRFHVTLSWDAVTHPLFDHYVVYWGTSSGARTSRATGTIGGTISVPDDAVYYFEVRSADAKNNESRGFSNEVVTVLPYKSF